LLLISDPFFNALDIWGKTFSAKRFNV